MQACLYVLCLLTGLGVASANSDPERSPTCEPLKSDMCRSIGYNMTGMPNLAMHTLQSEANFELATYVPLISMGCANELQFLLCSVYVPMCVEQEVLSPQKLIGPCRPLCERVEAKCSSVLKKMFHLPWPQVLNCSKFPYTNVHEHMCMEGPGEGQSPLGLPPSSVNDMWTNEIFRDMVIKADGKKMANLGVFKPIRNFVELFENDVAKIRPAQGINVQCGLLKKSSRYHYIKRANKCIPECGAEISYREEDKATTDSLIIYLAAFCFVLSTCTFVIYIVNAWGASSTKSVTAFAANTAMFLALSYVGYSFGYLLSELGFRPSNGLCVHNDEDETVLLLAQEGHRSRPCIVVFLFVYFFTQAASAWWTVVALSWCLAQWWTSQPQMASLQQRSRVATVSMFCHLYGWGVPAALTVAAVVLHLVEADEMATVCLPGALQDDQSLLIFMVVPEGIQLVLGAVLYLFGVCSAYFCGNATTSEAARGKQEAHALCNLRTRVSCFGFVYFLAKVCVLFTWIYEYLYRRNWLDATSQNDLPNPTVLWVRISMSLIIGISMPWWVATKETLLRWQRLGGCPQFWQKKNKAPPPPSQTPQNFPQVQYRPQAMVDNQVTIGHSGMARRQEYL